LITAQIGCDPTGIVLMTVSSMVEISVTLLLPWFTTKILLLAALPAIITGSVPTAIVAVTAKTPPAIKSTLLLPRLAMYILPLLLVAPATGSRLVAGNVTVETVLVGSSAT